MPTATKPVKRLPRASSAAAILAAVAMAAGAAVACAPLSGNVDPMSAVERGQVGLPVLSLFWKTEVADHRQERKPQEFASPAVSRGVGDDQRLYIGSHDGTFYALHARTGRIIWKIALGSISSRPVVHLGRIYVGTDDGLLVCLDTLEGDLKWKYATRGAILESPVLTEELIFFSNEADQVYALDLDTGKFRWQHKGDTPEEFTLRGHAGVAVDGELVFTGFANGTIVALRAATGSVAWMSSLRGEAERFIDVDGTPVVQGDRVYVTSSSGGVYALDKTTGLVRWRLPIRNAGGLTVDEHRVYVAAANEGVYALDLAGHVIWRQGTRGGGEPATPLVTGDYVLFALSEDGLYIADKRTGRVHQYFQPGDGVSATPTLAGDQMYVMSNGGYLYAMSIERF